AFDHFFQKPRCGEVYNIGGGRFSHCSMLEAIQITQEISGQEFEFAYDKNHRKGDQIWYVSDVSKFQSHYPNWQLTRNIRDIIHEIYEANVERWQELAVK
ncbi:MAG: NAD-dependent epimerase, partial [Planctomycetaceae bacterium]|nr:NAD-dependent epimerase [Planctomycetaceae bacterium]